MRVHGLALLNFRGFHELVLGFPELGPAVLLGVNGAGKTSVVDALAILLSRLIARATTASGMGRGLADGDRRAGAQFAFCMAEVSAFGHSAVVDAGRGAALSAAEVREIARTVSRDHGLPEPPSIALRALGKMARAFAGFPTWEPASPETVEAMRAEVASRPGLPVCVRYGTNRAVLDIPIRIRTRHTFTPLDAYDGALKGAGTDFRRFFEWFRLREDDENEQRARGKPRYRDPQLQAVRQAITALVPEFSDLRVRRSPRLRMTVRKHGEELSVDYLSDGEKCLLAMVGDLARRLAIANPGSKKPLAGEGVVLIDEIELHLHPRWQRQVVPLLQKTFPNCQFIVTTQSPIVVSELRDATVLVLRREGDRQVCVEAPPVYGRDANRILEEIMEVPERPEAIQDRLRAVFAAIARGELEDANRLVGGLREEIGDDPELVRAEALIHRKEILGR
jgi:hypothetical protein